MERSEILLVGYGRSERGSECLYRVRFAFDLTKRFIRIAGSGRLPEYPHPSVNTRPIRVWLSE